jgi:hypothetical protein
MEEIVLVDVGHGNFDTRANAKRVKTAERRNKTPVSWEVRIFWCLAFSPVIFIWMMTVFGVLGWLPA